MPRKKLDKNLIPKLQSNVLVFLNKKKDG